MKQISFVIEPLPGFTAGSRAIPWLSELYLDRIKVVMISPVVTAKRRPLLSCDQLAATGKCCRWTTRNRLGKENRTFRTKDTLLHERSEKITVSYIHCWTQTQQQKDVIPQKWLWYLKPPMVAFNSCLLITSTGLINLLALTLYPCC